MIRHKIQGMFKQISIFSFSLKCPWENIGILFWKIFRTQNLFSIPQITTLKIFCKRKNKRNTKEYESLSCLAKTPVIRKHFWKEEIVVEGHTLYDSELGASPRRCAQLAPGQWQLWAKYLCAARVQSPWPWSCWAGAPKATRDTGQKHTNHKVKFKS